MSKVAKSFICRGCLNPVTSATGTSAKLELVDKFCYLGEMLSVHGDADTIQYDARCYFNVRSKADMSRLNLPHGNDN